MPTSKQQQLRQLALRGATMRLAELREEEQAIRAEFPELFRGGRGPRAGTHAAADAPPTRRRKRTMSAAQRKAVSERMRKYWAERRRAKGGK